MKNKENDVSNKTNECEVLSDCLFNFAFDFYSFCMDKEFSMDDGILPPFSCFLASLKLTKIITILMKERTETVKQ